MKLKVAHVITMLELGGAQQNTLFTVGHLDRERFEPILAFGPGGMLDDEAQTLGIPAFSIAGLIRPVRPFSDVRALIGLTRLFSREKPDIVHTHSSKAGILGRLAALLAGVPVRVHTYHGFGFNERQAAPVRWVYIAAEWLCGFLSDALIFVSNANLDTARKLGLGRPDSYRLIRSGIELGRFPPAGLDRGKTKAAAGIGMHKPFVLSVGNLKPQKNPEDFVKVARLVLDKLPEARFLFVGDGELRVRCEALVLREKLHGKLLFPGWRRDVHELLASADVFVLTSLWEGLPRSLIEAMRCSVVPVCYDTDGVRDLVREGVNGYLARPGDAETLAGRVSELLADDALRRRMGEEAKSSIGPEFDIEGMVRAQEKLYDELARQSPRRRVAA
jgi:glycosyltransferase involved in cell wall biosynthesis